MENYVDGKEYFIKGTARSSEVPGRPVEFVYDSGYGTNCGVLADAPGLLLTAEEVVASHNRDIANLERAVEELRVENDELKAKIDDLEADLNNARHVNEYAVETEKNRISSMKVQIKRKDAMIEALLDKLVPIEEDENNV
jgi:CO/xanthine dehydrogenase Mo-binding subunit